MDVYSELGKVIDRLGLLHSRVQVLHRALAADVEISFNGPVDVEKYFYCVGALDDDLGELYGRMHTLQDAIEDRGMLSA